MKHTYELTNTINDTHIPTFNGHYLATFWLNNKLVTRPAYVNDLLRCGKCGKVMLPQDCLEYGDPCPNCQEDEEIYEFSWSDYNSYDEVAELLEKNNLDIHKFLDDDEIAYQFEEWA